MICGKLKEGQQPTLAQRIYASLITSAFGILVACPTDVVKFRLQAEGKKPEEVPRKYNGSIDAYSIFSYLQIFHIIFNTNLN